DPPAKSKQYVHRKSLLPNVEPRDSRSRAALGKDQFVPAPEAPVRSQPAAAGINDGDLLPDLTTQAGGELLDVVDRVDDHGIGQVLRIEGSELVGQRQHFAAIVEIAGELEAAHRALGRGGGRCATTDDGNRVFGQLVHVDDVRDRAKHMEM